MKIEKDSRQMPSKQEFLAVKGFNDIIYAWFQVNSDWDGEKNSPRYISKKKINFSAMAIELNTSRQTISKRVNKLVEMGLLTEEKDQYILSILPEDVSMLIEKETMRKMMSSLNTCTISIYVYLFSRFWANRQQPYDITLKQIKTVVGIGISDSTNYRVTDILEVLAKLGLIEYELERRQGSDGGLKSIYVIKRVRNKIE